MLIMWKFKNPFIIFNLRCLSLDAIKGSKNEEERAEESKREDANTEMAGNIMTEPEKEVIFKGPFITMKFQYVQLRANGEQRIGWRIKTTNSKHLKVDPGYGCLDRGELSIAAIYCKPFDLPKTRDKNNENIIIEWVKAPAGTTKECSNDWFENADHIGQKSLVINFKT